jgi:hypothetical protein
LYGSATTSSHSPISISRYIAYQCSLLYHPKGSSLGEEKDLAEEV